MPQIPQLGLRAPPAPLPTYFGRTALTQNMEFLGAFTARYGRKLHCQQLPLKRAFARSLARPCEINPPALALLCPAQSFTAFG